MMSQRAQDLLQNKTPTASAAGATADSSPRVKNDIQLALKDPEQHQTLLLQTTCDAVAELFTLFKQQFPQPASTQNALTSLKAFFHAASAHLNHLNLLVNALATLKSFAGALAEDKFNTITTPTPGKRAAVASNHSPAASPATSLAAAQVAPPAASASPQQEDKTTVAELKFYSFYQVLSYTHFNVATALALLDKQQRTKIKLRQKTRILFEHGLYSVMHLFASTFTKLKPVTQTAELSPSQDKFVAAAELSPSQDKFVADVYVSLYRELNIILSKISTITPDQLAEQSPAPLTSYLTIFWQLALIMPHSEVLLVGEPEFFFLDDEPPSDKTEQKHTKPTSQFQTPLPATKVSSLSIPETPASARREEGDMTSPASRAEGSMTSPASRSDAVEEEADPKDKDDKQLIDNLASHTTYIFGTLLLSPDTSLLPAGPLFNSATHPLFPGKKIPARIAHVFEQLSNIIMWHGLYTQYQLNPTLSTENYLQLLTTPSREPQVALTGDIKNHLHDKFILTARQSAPLATPKATADFFAKLYCETCCALDASYTEEKNELNSFTENLFHQLTACFEWWPKVQERVFPDGIKKQGELVKPSRILTAMASGKKGSASAAGQYPGTLLRTGTAGVASTTGAAGTSLRAAPPSNTQNTSTPSAILSLLGSVKLKK